MYIIHTTNTSCIRPGEHRCKLQGTATRVSAQLVTLCTCSLQQWHTPTRTRSAQFVWSPTHLRKKHLSRAKQVTNNAHPLYMAAHGGRLTAEGLPHPHKRTPPPTHTHKQHTPNSQARAEQDAAYLHKWSFNDIERPGVHLCVHPCLLSVLHHVLVHTLFACRTACVRVSKWE